MNLQDSNPNPLSNNENDRPQIEWLIVIEIN